MMQLTNIIKEKIERHGPMSFRHFMDMCLYYPRCGYYTSNREPIGALGDFYTAPLLDPVFGYLLGRQLEEMWCLLGQTPFTIVEYGAGTGLLCRDIITYLQQNERLFKELRYCIIEANVRTPYHLPAEWHEKISFHNSIAEIGESCCCIISNELLDNFAVHRVMMQEELMEVFVDYDNGFREVLLPASLKLKDYFKDINITLPPGFCTEVNLQARAWLADIAQTLQRGFIITIDYGFLKEELYNPSRKCGTIRCYHKHTMHTNLYENIGEQDITAHVDFSSLNYWGKQLGLECCGYVEQGLFLRALGMAGYLRNAEAYTASNNKALLPDKLAMQQLLTDMGHRIKVLIQKKGTVQKFLTGMAFSNPVLV